MDIVEISWEVVFTLRTISTVELVSPISNNAGIITPMNAVSLGLQYVHEVLKHVENKRTAALYYESTGQYCPHSSIEEELSSST